MTLDAKVENCWYHIWVFQHQKALEIGNTQMEVLKVEQVARK